MNTDAEIYVLLCTTHVDCYKRSESSAHILAAERTRYALVRRALTDNLKDVLDSGWTGFMDMLKRDGLFEELFAAGAFENNAATLEAAGADAGADAETDAESKDAEEEEEEEEEEEKKEEKGKKKEKDENDLDLEDKDDEENDDENDENENELSPTEIFEAFKTSTRFDDIASEVCARILNWIPGADTTLLDKLLSATLATAYRGEFGLQRTFRLCDVVCVHLCGGYDET
jgi:hypothetical protein